MVDPTRAGAGYTRRSPFLVDPTGARNNSSDFSRPLGVESNLGSFAAHDSEASSTLLSRKLPIDAIFRPVKKVNFVVEEDNSLSSDNLNKEQIMLEVWTNSTLG